MNDVMIAKAMLAGSARLINKVWYRPITPEEVLALHAGDTVHVLSVNEVFAHVNTVAGVDENGEIIVRGDTGLIGTAPRDKAAEWFVVPL